MKILVSCMVGSVLAFGAAAASAEPPASAEPEAGRALAIVAPAEELTIFNEGAVVTVSLAADPPLAEDERIVVRVDKQIVVLPSGATNISISGVPIGAHVIEAIIVDAELKPLAAAETITFRIGAGVRA